MAKMAQMHWWWTLHRWANISFWLGKKVLHWSVQPNCGHYCEQHWATGLIDQQHQHCMLISDFFTQGTLVKCQLGAVEELHKHLVSFVDGATCGTTMTQNCEGLGEQWSTLKQSVADAHTVQQDSDSESEQDRKTLSSTCKSCKASPLCCCTGAPQSWASSLMPTRAPGLPTSCC